MVVKGVDQQKSVPGTFIYTMHFGTIAHFDPNCATAQIMKSIFFFVSREQVVADYVVELANALGWFLTHVRFCGRGSVGPHILWARTKFILNTGTTQ